MYYELYIDVFFLVNFMMDIFVLGVAKNILKCPATCGSICFGAFAGAALTCLVIILPIETTFIKFMIFHGLISIFMTRTGLKIKFNNGLWKACAVVYISGFLIGGIFSCIKQYIREGAVFFVIAWLSYMLVLVIWRFLVSLKRIQDTTCEVLLINQSSQVKVKAILDTGNRLHDPITGKPVSIISKRTANILWKEIPKEGLRYIPYLTIEGKGGILPMLMVEKMCLYQECEIWMSKVLVAICEEKICTGDYEMILNPDMR
jgi:stage II sporulation protein GA (sporulation sigma-E factor processing peptidase)